MFVYIIICAHHDAVCERVARVCARSRFPALPVAPTCARVRRVYARCVRAQFLPVSAAARNYTDRGVTPLAPSPPTPSPPANYSHGVSGRGRPPGPRVTRPVPLHAPRESSSRRRRLCRSARRRALCVFGFALAHVPTPSAGARISGTFFTVSAAAGRGDPTGLRLFSYPCVHHVTAAEGRRSLHLVHLFLPGDQYAHRHSIARHYQIILLCRKLLKISIKYYIVVFN